MATAEEFEAAALSRAATPFDCTAAFQDMAPLVKANVQANFDNESTAGGEAWAPHKPATIARHGVHPILHLSGKMEAAAAAEGVGHIENVTPESLEYGVSKSEIPYAGVHQFGYEPNNIPQREYLAVSDETVDRMTEIFADRMFEQIIAAF